MKGGKYMKPRIQWIAALFTAASAGLAFGAFGCGYSTETIRLAPVREMVVEQPSSLSWGTPFHAVGSVISAPFVALGNAFSPSVRYVEPVGERLTYPVTYHRTWVSRQSTMLMPVGERFTTVKTVKIIRSKTLLKPVGERFITVKHHHKTMLKPVGERFTTVKIIRSKRLLLEPVGERITTIKYIKMAPVLEPVGERTIIRTTRVYSEPSWFCY